MVKNIFENQGDPYISKTFDKHFSLQEGSAVFKLVKIKEDYMQNSFLGNMHSRGRFMLSEKEYLWTGH